MLTDDQLDYILSSIGNYIEVGHGDEIQPYFEPIIDAIDSGKYQRIAIRACHAVGKTFTNARIGDAIMGSYDEVKLISTAPTYRQVHDLLWKEWTTAYNNKLPELKRGKLNETELWINSETFARGFSPQRRVKSETGQGTDSVFQGYHGKFMTAIIFDEATGIDPQLWEQAEGLLNSGYRVLIIAIGNPTSRNCQFFKCFSDRSWKKFSITCFDSPNLKANNINSIEDIEAEVEIIESLPDDEAIDRLSSYLCPVPYLINTRWVIEKAIEWGVSHPLFLGKVIGEFPTEDSDSIISEEHVIKSQERPWQDIDDEKEGYVGLDVARFGIDKSILSSMVGLQQTDDNKAEFNGKRIKRAMSKNDTNQVVGNTLNYLEWLQDEYPNVSNWRLAIDGGFGHGVIDRLKELQEQNPEKEELESIRVYNILSKVEILEINFGSSDWVMFHYGWCDEFTRRKRWDDRKVQEDRENYANFKAKMFDLLAMDIKKTLRLISDDTYSKQLPTIRKDVDSKGRLKIESKEDYKKRTGETSPDESDSLALCNFARYFASTTSVFDIMTRN